MQLQGKGIGILNLLRLYAKLEPLTLDYLF
jgi:hypothetical protein